MMRQDDLDKVRIDPAYGRVTDALDRYAGTSTCRWLDAEDGSGFPVPEITDQDTADKALSDLLGARADLASRHDREKVSRALQKDAIGLLDPGMEQGYDCDGVTFHEPYGRPQTPVLRAVANETAKERLREQSNGELLKAQRELAERADAHTRADNHHSARLLDAERRALDEVIAERRAESEKARPWTWDELRQDVEQDREAFAYDLEPPSRERMDLDDAYGWDR